MRISERLEKESVVVFALDGPLVIGRDSKKLEWLVGERVKEGRTKIIVDLEGAAYVDSAGIGVIVAALSNVTRAGGQMHLPGVNDFVRGILEKTGVDGLIPIDATVDAAVSALAAPSD